MMTICSHEQQEEQEAEAAAAAAASEETLWVNWREKGKEAPDVAAEAQERGKRGEGRRHKGCGSQGKRRRDSREEAARAQGMQRRASGIRTLIAKA